MTKRIEAEIAKLADSTLSYDERLAAKRRVAGMIDRLKREPAGLRGRMVESYEKGTADMLAANQRLVDAMHNTPRGPRTTYEVEIALMR